MRYEDLPVQTIYPLNGELNERSSTKLQGYHQMVCLAAENEMARCGRPISETLARGYAWALISMTVRVTNPIKDSAPRLVRSWLGKVTMPYVRREVEALTESGELSFGASLFSVPFSVESRGIIRDFDPQSELEIFTAFDRVLVEGAKNRMRDCDGEFERLGVRKVMPSDIDALGHMNNCRYGAMIYDALTDEGRRMLDRPFEYTIDFRRQLAPDAEVTLERRCEDGRITVRGFADDNGRPSFTGRVTEI